MERRELRGQHSHSIIEARSLRFERIIDARDVLDIDITTHGNRDALLAQYVPLLYSSDRGINDNPLLRVQFGAFRADPDRTDEMVNHTHRAIDFIHDFIENHTSFMTRFGDFNQRCRNNRLLKFAECIGQSDNFSERRQNRRQEREIIDNIHIL